MYIPGVVSEVNGLNKSSFNTSVFRSQVIEMLWMDVGSGKL